AERLKQVLMVKEGKVFFQTQLTAQSFDEWLGRAGQSKRDYLDAADLAASGQYVYAYFVNEIIERCKQYEEENLILSGGCALNSSFNGSLVANSSFAHIHVPSAPADDGNAIGSALLAWMEAQGTQKIPYIGTSPY